MATGLVFPRRGSTTLIWYDKLRTQSVGELNMFNLYFMGARIYSLIFNSQENFLLNLKYYPKAFMRKV